MHEGFDNQYIHILEYIQTWHHFLKWVMYELIITVAYKFTSMFIFTNKKAQQTRFATSGQFRSQLAHFEVVQPASKLASYTVHLCRSIRSYKPIQPGGFEVNC